MTEIPYVRQTSDFAGPVRYAYGPDSYRQPGVPHGTILDHVWSPSRIFPDTTRRYWVYVPAQYTASEPASLMVFQDGHFYLDSEGEIRAPIVFDNLIHRGEMPVTIGVFVGPGIFAAELPAELGSDPEPENRNVEYDTFSDAYATFLLTEILPNVQDRYLITDDPDQWAIGGGSSGGSCAFIVGWTRPDRFRRVLSFLGSFAQIRGGNYCPELIQDTPKKPLRVFLQAATRDLNWDAAEFNWFSANLRVAALRWLWRRKSCR
jgi:enterochelin esterase-like enzyme